MTRLHGGLSPDTWRTLGRHQLGAVAATIVDFAVMIALVQGAHASAVAATAVGAALGGVTNFFLGRTWIFGARSGAALAQGVRYALVSGAGAGWNTLGEHLLHDVAGLQYVVARAVVSLGVSLFWSFPMQRHFVFHGAGAPRETG